MRQLPDAGSALFTQALGPVVAAAGDALRDVGEDAPDRLGECPLVPLPKENANLERTQAGAFALLTRLQLGGNLL
jgi:hypothetical protein